MPTALPRAPMPRCPLGRLLPSLLVVFGLLSLSGCASLGPRLVAPHSEYMAYRAVRTSAELEPRLAASWTYLSRYPHGHWTGEVALWFEKAEPRYYELRRESPLGLLAYLRTLPSGPHAEEASQRLERYRALAAQARAERLTQAAQVSEARFAALAAERDQAKASLGLWLGRLLALTHWGQPIDQLEPEFLQPWKMEPGLIHCESSSCTKLIQKPYSLPGGGEKAKRVLLLEVQLGLQDDAVQQATLQGPELFSRLYELSTLRPLEPQDVSGRVAAIAQAVAQLEAATSSRFPPAQCAQEPVAPVVLARQCQGGALSMRAAEHPGEDDQIVLRWPKAAPAR